MRSGALCHRHRDSLPSSVEAVVLLPCWCAHRFIDLDKNMFVGAAELRHVLICMGELITDEEIDEMIRMVDVDGDGQVSFDEFNKLAKHPDPSRPDFNSILDKDSSKVRGNGLPVSPRGFSMNVAPS